MATDPLQSASTAITRLSRTLNHLVAANALLDRLETQVMASRAQRASNVRVSDVKLATQTLSDGSGIPVQVTAKTGDKGYNTRITFHPRQGVNCTCPDLQNRKMACKHVAALAIECRKRLTAIMDIIEGDVERFSIQIEGIETSANTLASTAAASLTNSLRALES